jgi:hypothetical protein
MDLEAYKSIVKDEVRRIEVAGKTHFFKLPGYLDVDLFTIMKGDSPQQEKMIQCLAAVICDESGNRIFSGDNAEHVAVIKSLPNDLQIGLITKVSEAFFPKESKAQD